MNFRKFLENEKFHGGHLRYGKLYFPDSNTVQCGVYQQMQNVAMLSYQKTKFHEKTAPLAHLLKIKDKIELIEHHAPRLPFKLNLSELKIAKDIINNMMIEIGTKGGMLHAAITQSLPRPKTPEEMLKQIHQQVNTKPIPHQQWKEFAEHWENFRDLYEKNYQYWQESSGEI